MLRISLDLVPYGDENKIESLGVMEIGNIKSDGDIADYIVRLNGDEVGTVNGFARSQGAWHLVLQAIELLPHDLRQGGKSSSDLQDLVEFILKVKGADG